MKKTIFVLVMLLFVVDMSAQPKFLKNHNYYPGHAVETQDGSVVIVGTTAAAKPDIFLFKIDSNGDTIWTKSYGGLDNDGGRFLSKTPDQGFIIVGSTSSFGATYSSNIYLIKTDSAGNLQWSKVYHQAAFDYGRSVSLASDGGYFVGGVTKTSLGAQQDILLLKVDTLGNIVWTKKYGSSQEEELFSMQTTSDGGFLLGSETAGFGLTGTNIYIIKADTIGNIDWSKTYTSSKKISFAYINQVSDGSIFFTGNYLDTDTLVNTRDVLLVKLDSSGNVIIGKRFHNNSKIFGLRFVEIDNQGILLMASFQTPNSMLALIQLDSSLNVVWAKGHSTIGYSTRIFGTIFKTNDNGYFALATRDSYVSLGFIILKTDIAGNAGCSDSILVFTDSVTIINSTSQITPVSSGGVVLPDTTISGYTPVDFTTICYNAVGINEVIQMHDFKVYPNPVNSSLIVEYDFVGIASLLNVKNIMGQVVYSTSLKHLSRGKNLMNIDLEFLKLGMYFVEIHTNQQSYSKKIIKN